VTFTAAGLVYLTDPFGGAKATLKAWAAKKRFTLDTQVVSSFSPTPAILVSPRGDRVAYQAKISQTSFAAELHLATLPTGTKAPPAPTVLATDTVPNAFGWSGGGSTLVYLHAAESTFPGAGLGELSARDLDHASTLTLGAHVTQIGLKTDPASDDVLFLEGYDASQATGTLTTWSAASHTARVLGNNAAVMSIDRGPDGEHIGFLTATFDPTGQNPPATSFSLARLHGPWPTSTVAADANSLAVGWLGRVFYTTPNGVYAAWVL
jgi:hypothetical protein